MTNDKIDALSTIYHVPNILIEGLAKYVEHKIPTGDFLRAILSNDLMQAVSRADNYNINYLREIVTYIHSELPVGCYGSKEAVERWIKK